MKYCRECGNQMKEEARFCPYCGAAQQEVNQRDDQQPATPSWEGQYQHFNEFQQQYRGTDNVGTQVPLGFIGSAGYAIARWRDFHTLESRRSIFWWSLLWIVLMGNAVILVAGVLQMVTSNIPVVGELVEILTVVIAGVIFIFFGIVEIAAIVRRLVCLNMPRLLVILMFIPGVNLLLLCLMIVGSPRDTGMN